MKRAFTVLLAVVLLALPVTAFANDIETPADDPIPEEYAYLDKYDAAISISGTTATCSASVKAKTSCSLSITMELQKLSSGSYGTIKTWGKTGTGMSLSDSRTHVVSPYNTYRLKATLTAGGESVVLYRYP